MVNSNSKKFGNPHGIDYKSLDTKQITAVSGIPIDETHRYTDPYKPEENWMLERETRIFRRKATPHVVIDVPDVGAIIYKHIWTGGQYGTSVGDTPGFCCGASR